MGWVRRALDLVTHSARHLSGDPWKRAGLDDWILDVDNDRKYSDQTTMYVDQALGDDTADGNIARPMATLGEALRNVWARRQAGNLAEITLILIGTTGVDGVDSPTVYTWPAGYDEMKALTIQGSGRLVSLSAQDVGATINNRTSRTGGHTLTLSVDPSWTPNVSLRDGYFVQNDAADGDWRAIAGATASDTIRYSGGNYGDNLIPVAVPTDDVTIFKPGTQIDFDTLMAGEHRRVEWSDVTFNRVELTSPLTTTRTIIAHNGPAFIRGSSCRVRLTPREYGSVTFERAFWRPYGNVSYSVFGELALLGAVVRGDGGGNFSMGTGQFSVQNYNVMLDWPQSTVRFTGHASVRPGSWGTLHFDNCGGLESVDARVECFGPLRLLGTLAVATVNMLEVNNGSYWAWDPLNDVMQSDDVTPAEVSADNGATAVSADLATNTLIPGWTDYAADYTTSFTAVTGIS